MGTVKSQAWDRSPGLDGLSLIEEPDKEFQFWKVGCGVIILFTAFAALSRLSPWLLAITTKNLFNFPTPKNGFRVGWNDQNCEG